MTYSEVCHYLFTLPRFEKTTEAYKPGLAKTQRLLAAMGHPEANLRMVHVGGTNGKGSTSSMLAAICTASGLKTGLYTSPHLFDFTERMRIDGVPVSETWLIAALGRFKPLFDAEKPSFFEAVTCLAFLYFAESKVDMAVIEVGLGGRLDATNVIVPLVSAVTNIDFDHTEQLGNRLTEIAGEKAGIIKEGIPFFTTADQEEVLEVFKAGCTNKNTVFHEVLSETVVNETKIFGTYSLIDITTPLRVYPHLHIGLAGAHQLKNARLALRIAESIVPEIPEPAIRHGLEQVLQYTGLKGRSEVLQKAPLIIADVAHNEAGWAAAFANIARQIPEDGRLFVMFGAMRDKSLEKLAQLLSRYKVATVMPLSTPSERGRTASEILQALPLLRIPSHVCSNMSLGISWFKAQARPQDALLITGSHLVVSELSEGFLNKSL